MSVSRRVARSAFASATLLVGLSCSTGDTGHDGRDADTGAQLEGELLVLAAASLADVFADLAVAFEAANPGIDVQVSVGGSNALAVQIEEGAPADVFASANIAVMDDLSAAELTAAPQVFARTELALATPIGNPADVTGLADLERDELFVGACAEQVPCGAYAADLFAQAGVEPSIDTREPNVRSVVAKLIEGELDVGVVYASDIIAFPDDVTAIMLPSGVSVEAQYPISTLRESRDREAAQAFVDFVLSDAARPALVAAGFEVP